MERNREMRDLRRARRLVQAELDMADATLAGLLGLIADNDEETFALVLKAVTTEEWDAHKDALAAALKDEDWSVVRHAYILLPMVARLADAQLNFEERSSDPRGLTETTRQAVREAREALDV